MIEVGENESAFNTGIILDYDNKDMEGNASATFLFLV